MQMLLEAGTDATAQDYQGRTALHLACTINNDPEKVRLLINAGVALDAQDHNGKTALMEAVVDGSYEVVELLLAAGALPA
jgi:ankyrin repeat protein